MKQMVARCPAVFLDRDGTPIEDRGHLSEASEVAFYLDAIDALWRLQEHFLLFLVTNQSGMARSCGQSQSGPAVPKTDAPGEVCTYAGFLL